jgi:WD40 repeat protein
MYKVRRPEPEEIDNKESYYWDNADIKEWTIKIMEFQMAKNQKKDPEEEEKKRRMRLRGELPPEEDEPEEVWEPSPLTNMALYPNDDGKPQYLVSTNSDPKDMFRGFLYVCDFDEERPIQAIKNNPDAAISHMSVSKKRGGEAVVLGQADGEVQLIMNRNWERRMSLKNHDISTGKINSTCFNHDEQFFFTVADDGLMNVHQFDKLAAIEEVQYDPL